MKEGLLKWSLANIMPTAVSEILMFEDFGERKCTKRSWEAPPMQGFTLNFKKCPEAFIKFLVSTERLASKITQLQQVGQPAQISTMLSFALSNNSLKTV